MLVQVVITAGVNVVPYNEGVHITNFVEKLLRILVHAGFNTALFRRLT